MMFVAKSDEDELAAPVTFDRGAGLLCAPNCGDQAKDGETNAIAAASIKARVNTILFLILLILS
jgi:hypothetical protein